MAAADAAGGAAAAGGAVAAGAGAIGGAAKIEGRTTAALGPATVEAPGVKVPVGGGEV